MNPGVWAKGTKLVIRVWVSGSVSRGCCQPPEREGLAGIVFPGQRSKGPFMASKNKNNNNSGAILSLRSNGGEAIYEQGEVSWSPRGDVISLMRNEEAVLSRSFCFLLSGRPWPPASVGRLPYIIPEQSSFSAVPCTCPPPTLQFHIAFVPTCSLPRSLILNSNPQK